MIYHDAVKIIIRIQGCFTTNEIYTNKNIFYTWFSLLPLSSNNFLTFFELYQQHPQVHISTICSRQFRHTQSCPGTLYLPPPSAWFQSHTCILSIKVAISLFGIKIVFCCCLINYWNCNSWKHYTVIISLIESTVNTKHSWILCSQVFNWRPCFPIMVSFFSNQQWISSESAGNKDCHKVTESWEWSFLITTIFFWLKACHSFYHTKEERVSQLLGHRNHLGSFYGMTATPSKSSFLRFSNLNGCVEFCQRLSVYINCIL